MVFLRGSRELREHLSLIVAVTLQSTLAESNPETALRWAKLIVDPLKRAAAEPSILARASGAH